MPILPFASLPDAARVWVFASDRPLDDDEGARLLAEVDRFLLHWHAHGQPLDAGRDWAYDRFLTVAVDEAAAGASGCSIDGLYRALRALEAAFGATLLDGGAIHFRGPDGTIERVARADLAARAREGAVRRDTVLFDPSVTTLGEWRERFEAPLHAGRLARLLPPPDDAAHRA